MIGILLVIAVAFVALLSGVVVGMLITAHRADIAMAIAIENEFCTRPAPHKCRVNGPCNGYPKEAWQDKWEAEAKAEGEGRSMLL